MPVTRDPRPRPLGLLSTKDPRPRPSTRSPQPFPTAPVLEISPISLPSPSSPSEGRSQIVAMGPRSSEHKWLTREDLKKLPKIPKIKCGAKATPTSPSEPEQKPTFTVSTPAILIPMTPPGRSLEFGQRLKSPGSEITKTSASALQIETGMPMTLTPQWSIFPPKSTGQNSTQATPTNGPESSQKFSLPLTPPLTPTADFAPSSLSRNVDVRESTFPSSMKSSTKVQEHDRLDMPRGRGGVRSELKETSEPLAPRTLIAIRDLQNTFPLEDARKTSSQVQKTSSLACTTTDSSGRATQRVVNSSPRTQETRSSKEFNMDSYNSCDCRSGGGQDCMYCRILKGAFEFCKRVDHKVKEK